MPAFVLERYLPGVSRTQVERVIARDRALAREMAAEGRAISVLHATFVEDDEAVMSVVEAASRQDAVELGDRSGTPPDRVVRAVEVASSPAEDAP